MRLSRKTALFILGIITIISIFLRFYKLESLPWNMQEDEVMTGYVGRFILQNGKDVYGNKTPLLYFNKFGDYYIIGPIYMKGLSTYVFGINAFAIRFPTALFGALTTIPIYLLGSLLFSSNLVGIFSALAVAIMPWTIPLARASSEGILGGFFFLFGIYFLLKGQKQDKIIFLLIGGLFILFTFWIYHNYRLLSSLFVLGLMVYTLFEKKRDEHNKVVLPVLGGIIIFFLFLTFIISQTTWGRGRFDQTGILSPLSGVAIRTQELIYGDGQTPTYITRVFHNKVIGLGREFLHQYFIYFSGDFLFIKGGKSEAYAVPEQGLLYLTFIIPLLAIFLLVTDRKWMEGNRNNLLLLVYFILISPIPSALTIVDAPNIQRSILLGLLLSIPIGLGMESLLIRSDKKKLLFSLLFIALVAEFAYYWHDYTAHTNSFTGIYRNDGQKNLMTYLKDVKTSRVYLSTNGTMPMYYLFYTKNFSQNLAGKFRIDVRIDNIDNLNFIDKECPSKADITFKESDVIVDSISCLLDPKKYREIKIIKGENELLGFRVVSPLSTKK